MRLARLDTSDGPRCAVAFGAGWLPVQAVLAGLGPDDPAAALAAAAELRAALAGLTGSPTPDGWLPERGAALLCPLPRPGKIFGIGLNYREHITETKGEVPAVPTVFAKFANAMAGPADPIPAHATQTARLDYEGELAVVVGRRCRDLDERDALDVVGAYAVANDVSARDLQFHEGGQWTHAKTLDGFCPLGPWLTTAEEIPDPQALELSTHVNGERRQHTGTADMVFPVRALVAFLSRGITLEPGDLILTGTPGGVALGRDDRPWLRPGDVVRVEISGLGVLENTVA
jgi:2-keto-4-pentenoate hydratase/2-oxohepta-3-ene-1,7-dioic acid hydratase in catechol pathway